MHVTLSQCLLLRNSLSIYSGSISNASLRSISTLVHVERSSPCPKFQLPGSSPRKKNESGCFGCSSNYFLPNLLNVLSISLKQCRGVKIYTKTGDKGTSGTSTGKRHLKDHEVFVALGTLDELSAHIGLAKEFGCERNHPYTDQLERVQCLLQDSASSIASAPPYPNPAAACVLNERHVQELEEWIDKYSAHLPPLSNFILPGGGRASAGLHVARTICRRAERTLVALRPSYSVPQDVFVYVNRLSDYLFTIARYATVLDGSKEVIYINPTKPQTPVIQSDSQTPI